jgi:RNA polymerase sigma factor (sigma-70 family)
MYAISLPLDNSFSVYHSVMADSGFFASRELKASTRSAETATLDPLVERDRILAGLVARMAKRDEAAMSELYDMTVKRLHSFALRIVRDTGLAEEVTEDCLFQAWREANRYELGRGKVITWLLTICRSRALDALRRADIAESVEDPDEFRAQEASLMAEPEQLIGQFETNSAVHEALLKLPAKERQAVSLAFFRGLTHQEIADHWQMPLGSVKTLMHRAFAQLRTHLEAQQ